MCFHQLYCGAIVFDVICAKETHATIDRTMDIQCTTSRLMKICIESQDLTYIIYMPLKKQETELNFL